MNAWLPSNNVEQHKLPYDKILCFEYCLFFFFCLICPKLSERGAVFGKGLHNFYYLSDEMIFVWIQQRTVTRLSEDPGWGQRCSVGEVLGAIQYMEMVWVSVIVTFPSAERSIHSQRWLGSKVALSYRTASVVEVGFFIETLLLYIPSWGTSLRSGLPSPSPGAICPSHLTFQCSHCLFVWYFSHPQTFVVQHPPPYWLRTLHPVQLLLKSANLIDCLETTPHLQTLFAVRRAKHIWDLKSQKERKIQVVKDLRKSLILPPALSRNSYDIRPDCSGLYSVGSWKP